MRYLASVSVGSTQLNAQSTGKSGFGLATIGARMVMTIAFEHLPRPCPIEIEEIGRQGDKETCQPRGEKVNQIVKPGGRPTKLNITLIFIAKRRIKGVDRFIKHRSRWSRDKRK